VIVIDAAQAMAHSSDVLRGTQADVICFSAHKMYAPSLGGMVVRKDLLPKIQTTFIGGGMVDDVTREDYQLSADSPQHVYTKFESGLQAWGEIVALGEAIRWLQKLPAEAHRRLETNTQNLYKFLSSKTSILLLNQVPNPTMSFYVKGLDSHLLGAALADAHIMARTGYFCAHYYLDHVKHYPPLVRFALGYHNSEADIEKAIEALEKVTK
jgi:cysteine desulfurase/selenocysteine lyase